MRTSVAWSLALLLTPGLAVAESMGAAAQKEQERRKTVESQDKASSFDDQDLAEVHRTRRDARATATPSATQAPAGAPEMGFAAPYAPYSMAIPADGADAGESRSRAEEQRWKTRAREARQRVRSAEREAESAEKARDYWRDGACKYYGNGYCSPSVLENSSAQRTFREAQTRLLNAKEDLDAVEEEARRSSIPPGWLRD